MQKKNPKKTQNQKQFILVQLIINCQDLFHHAEYKEVIFGQSP